MSQTEANVQGSGPQQALRYSEEATVGGLRQQWKLLGLFEIDQQHDYYSLTCMMKEGLAVAVQNCIDNPTPDKLSEKDFRLEVTQIHEGFRMETFAGPVFSSLRRSLAMTEKEYLHSLCSSGCYLQFISNSKSKADFFLTNDKRFFLKTQNRREVKFLLSNLRVYMEHLEKYPHSLLVKFLGVHRITIPHRKKKYFIVMQSVFYPDDRIHARYDIKGCEVSRWTEPAPEHSQVIVVLKDLNFEGQYITLAQQRPWLLRQMQMDTWFLQRLNVLDYSLLLAQQPLQQDERLQSLSFANLIMRTKKSVVAGTSPAHSDSGAVPGVVLGSESETGSLWVTGAQAGSDPPDALLNAAELQDFQVQNRRLLPCTRNPLHVIDGPEHRYFLGIIDIFTVYGFRKRLEHLWKRMRHPGKTFSTVSPSTYCVRLCSWVQNHSQ